MRLPLAFLVILYLPASLAAQVKIIYDTDMDTDCGDAGALAILHALADRGEADFWKVHTGGHNHIFENGTNQWRDGPETNHRLVELQPNTKGPLRETMDRLTVQAPRTK